MIALAENSGTWAAVVIVAVPALVIAASELDERLRQRDSPLRAAVATVRNWVLPLFALWALLVPVLDADRDAPAVRITATAFVLALAWATLQLFRIAVGVIQRRHLARDRQPLPQLLLALPRLLVLLVVAWLLVGVVWGIDLSAALTALGVTSLVVSFALQETLSGLASGVLLLGDQPFQPGDWISTDDTEGVVVDVNWRTSRLKDRNGDMVTVPNSAMANAKIVNYSRPARLHRVVVPVQVAFSNPPTLAKAMLLDAARGTDGVLTEPPPAVRVVQIDDPLMGYEVDMWIDDYGIAPRVRSDFGSLVWYQSHRHDVPLPSPAQDLYLYDGPETSTAGAPAVGELRRGIEQSPLLGFLADEDVDRLAQASRPLRYAVGEQILDARRAGRDLVLLAEGRAVIALVDDDGAGVRTETVVGELTAGESITSLGDVGEDRHLVVRAVSDCDVLVIDADVIGELGSRNTELAAAFNRLSSIRRRRIDRIVEQRSARNGAQEPAER
ncbi:MAG: mechanosensitive ion channel family protein [Actinomycetota bacterium]|nr:mechanosensitive ion channel family protein [Actinomycetota bacterium]